MRQTVGLGYRKTRVHMLKAISKMNCGYPTASFISILHLFGSFHSLCTDNLTRHPAIQSVY